MGNINGFSDRLSELLFENNLTAEQLSEKLGITKGCVSKWLAAKQKLSLESAMKLSRFFDCSLEFLIGRTDKKLDFVPQEHPSFYDRLMALMKERGKSRYQIVKQTKFSDGNFYSWKKGGSPYLQSVVDLADYFNCTLDYLVGSEK